MTSETKIENRNKILKGLEKAYEKMIAFKKERLVLRPHWPQGLEQGRFYQFNCDDDGRDGNAFFRVLVANDGDVHLCASKLLEPGFTDKVSGEQLRSIYDAFPSVRCRTTLGGGRHRRTRQALLWLARAIQLDNEELGIKE